MTHEELIAKAREHARLFMSSMQVSPSVIEGDARLRETVMVYFGNENDSLLKMTLDKETGEFINAESPGPI